MQKRTVTGRNSLSLFGRRIKGGLRRGEGRLLLPERISFITDSVLHKEFYPPPHPSPSVATGFLSVTQIVCSHCVGRSGPLGDEGNMWGVNPTVRPAEKTGGRTVF